MLFSKTLSIFYYQKNIGFYALVLFVGFGLINGTAHKQLIEQILSSKTLAFLFIGLCILHTFKTVFFIKKSIGLAQFTFFRTISLLSKPSYFLQTFGYLVGTNLIWIIYLVFIGLISLKQNTSINFFIILAVALVLLSIGSLFLMNKIPDFMLQKSKKTSNILPNTYPFYFLGHLLNNQPIVVLSTKLFSILFLIGSCYFYTTDQYDVRLFSLAFLFAAVAHIQIVKEFLDFEINLMAFNRNLPKTTITSFLERLIFVLILLAPEFLLLINYWPLPFTPYLNQFLWFISLVTFLFISVYTPLFNNKNVFSIAVILLLILVVIIMYKVAAIQLSGLFILAGYFLFNRYYKRLN